MEANNFQTINEKFTTGFFGQQILYYATAINISKEYPIGVGNKNFKLYCGNIELINIEVSKILKAVQLILIIFISIY